MADDVGEKVVYELVTPKFNQRELDEVARLINKKDPPIEEIERLAKAKRETSEK